ncbi:uncharacterized protein LOC128258553 [Drosophila gunungcola]|uniref:Uncharacterized protein n=1 Tax=Drosophila gunungcola TaxID=103775 RepID=A0A9Q0BQS3_9MUSC|nr:uncharacterized protein LOC128258553 [Drosophila gunungcola]KAI8040445.1 hypothetical protein M5D96_006388 [Drosophila gunungcola]
MSLSSLTSSIGHGQKEARKGLNINNKLVQALILLVACVLFGANLNYASFPPGTVIDIKLGDVTLEQFSYTPTRDGYEFNYTLPDGTFRDEVGKVLSGTSAAQDLENANNLAKNHRPSREKGLKVRKLSGKSLSSLAG